VDLTAATVEAYVRDAFGKLLAVVDRLGDDRVNRRPHGPHTNTVAALVVHCCGLTEFWLGHVALGEPTDRDRDAEFRHEATVAELHARVAATLARAHALLARIDAGGGGGGSVAGGRFRATLPDGEGGDAAVAVHVLEELYQHLGHAELTADALLA
jgi:hypothetical protein